MIPPLHCQLMAARNTMDNAIEDINRRMTVIDFYHEKNMMGSAQNEHVIYFT